MRDAENGEAFLGEIEWSYGFVTRLLDGTEEAAMMVRGVTAGRTLADDTLLVDIGGGSTELVLCAERRPGGIDEPRRRLRARHRALPGHRSSGAIRARCRSGLRALAPPRVTQPEAAIGVAGTVTTLAALDLELAEYDPERTHGHRVSRDSVERELGRLAGMTLEERLRVPGIEPGRAPVIVAGIVVLREIMDAFGLDEIEVSERDILHGAAFAAAELPEPEEGAAPPGAYTCC